jgi:hypothetical protein
MSCRPEGGPLIVISTGLKSENAFSGTSLIVNGHAPRPVDQFGFGQGGELLARTVQDDNRSLPHRLHVAIAVVGRWDAAYVHEPALQDPKRRRQAETCWPLVDDRLAAVGGDIDDRRARTL